MMRHELEARTGKLTDWQWEMAHHIYQNDPLFDGAGAKDTIAKFVKDGLLEQQRHHDYWSSNPLVKRYREMNGPVIVIKHDDDMYSTWDVNSDGYCINSRGKTIQHVGEQVKSAYEAKYPVLAEQVEYFSSNPGFGKELEPWPLNSRIAVFYVRGGSEGYYVHVDTIWGGTITDMMLVKTLQGDESARAWAEQTANALSRIMDV